MGVLVTYQWELFIFLEVFSWLFLLAFLMIRYVFDRESLGRIFLFLFILFIALEGMLAYIIYRQIGEMSTFQVVLILFVIYACTFGISDFKKLDRYIKSIVGKWRGIDLLTEKDKVKMERLKDPTYIAKTNRVWWYTHTAGFIIVHWFFWVNYGNDAYPFLSYVTDFSWFDGETLEKAPFTNEMVMQVSKIWMIIYAVDTIISLSYTIFPSGKKQ